MPVAEHHEANYKKGISISDGRRNRQDTAVQIRKAKRLESLKKRRNLRRVESGDSNDAAPSMTSTGANAKSTVFGDLRCSIENIARFAEAVKRTDNPTVHHEGIKYIRKLLSRAQDPPVDDILQAGVLPYLVEAIKGTDNLRTVFEASWALTNIASTEYTHVVVDSGACPYLVTLLRSNDADIREQAAWCLGNIAGDRTAYRDMLLGFPESIHNLLLNIKEPANLSLLKNVTWCLSNFCRGKPQPKLETIAAAIPALVYLLDHDDVEVLTDATWALSYISDGDDHRIEACVNSGAVPKLINLLGHSSSSVVTPALRVIGNLVSGNDQSTQFILNAGALSPLCALMKHKKKGIRKESCWAISNISAGTHDQIKTVLGNRDLMGHIITIATEGEWDVRKEATWAFCNIATGGTDEMIHQLFLLEGAWGCLAGLLNVADTKILTLALDAIDQGLRVGEQFGLDFAERFEEGNGQDISGLDALDNLQNHENETVYTKAVSLLEKYYGAEDENSDNTDMAPAVVGKTFSFGASAPPTAPAAPMSFNFGSNIPPAAPFNFGSTTAI